MYKIVAFARNELFDKVWSTPLLQLAKEIGVSDEALGKACRRAGIPLPGRGYWGKDARLRQKPRLAGTADQARDRIQFQIAVVPTMRERPSSDTEHQRKPIKISPILENPHPLVAQTLKAVRKDKVGIHAPVSHVMPRSQKSG